ncbi:MULTISPECIES: aspartyl-phosphate phosphatase Spo0E family protein [Bacillaceae]|uniref:aspartyl-phosphate phosphatase Spo0E family protein n=2 Tax=Bacillales TaxID=1385 RepID=UPI001BDE0891|nr:aspartyl-phosphate phosphatase Spo0E family protein [Cytobacillus sp. IB215316]MDX8362707.1 aspartyl-phosphate phosphatase Spo0E family protein [Cytobacillus sp. IB215316]
MMNNQRESQLLQQIEELRSEMITSGIQKGLNHCETKYLSQRLDDLLYKYQLMITNKYKNCR